MVRLQEKGPHRRLDNMRREDDRRLAEREQVTNHRRHKPPTSSANQARAGGRVLSAAHCKSLSGRRNVREQVAMAARI